MFAVVLLTGAGLGVELHHRGQLAVLAGKAKGAIAPVTIDFINACATVLAQVLLAVVDVIRAVGAGIPDRTVALVVSHVIYALTPVFARVVLFLTELDLRFAVLASEAGQALAPVGLDLVDARTVVFAFVCNTVVYISFASVAVETWIKFN